MASLNHIVLLGQLLQDPELRYTQDGDPVTHFTLAVQRPLREGSDAQTDYIRVATRRKLADWSRSLEKGDVVTVQGRLYTRAFEQRDGHRRRTVEVEAFAVEKVGGTEIPAHSQPTPQQTPKTTGHDPEDLPF